MSEDLKTTEGKLWEAFKNVKPDSEENINKKAEILDEINKVRAAQSLEPWNKWTKEDALKKLQESNLQGKQGTLKFFPTGRKTEVKVDELNKFHEFVDKLYEKEIPKGEKSKSLWRQDNIQYLELLVQVFNGQIKQR